MEETRVDSLKKRKNHKRIFIAIIAATFILLAGAGAYAVIALPGIPALDPVRSSIGMTGTFTGKVTDSQSGKPIEKTAFITISGKEYRTDAKGNFSLGKMPVGKYSLTLRAAGYESADYGFRIADGNNSQQFAMCLNPVESTKLWMEVKKLNQHDKAYEMLHPDEKVRIKKADYIRSKLATQSKYSLQIKTYEVRFVKILPQWTQPQNGLRYNDVAELKVSTTLYAAQQAKTYTRTVTMYAQKVNNRWSFLTGETAK